MIASDTRQRTGRPNTPQHAESAMESAFAIGARWAMSIKLPLSKETGSGLEETLERAQDGFLILFVADKVTAFEFGFGDLFVPAFGALDFEGADDSAGVHGHQVDGHEVLAGLGVSDLLALRAGGFPEDLGQLGETLGQFLLPIDAVRGEVELEEVTIDGALALEMVDHVGAEHLPEDFQLAAGGNAGRFLLPEFVEEGFAVAFGCFH